MKYLGSVMTLFLLVIGPCQTNSTIKGDLRQSKAAAKEPLQNPMFPTTPPEVRVSGDFLKAFLVASDAFKKDAAIPERKKEIGNYTFEFRQDKNAYFVYFIPKLLPNEEGTTIGGESELGRWVTYAVRKSDYTILARQFYK